jgi:hypothetical protein
MAISTPARCQLTFKKQNKKWGMRLYAHREREREGLYLFGKSSKRTRGGVSYTAVLPGMEKKKKEEKCVLEVESS